MLDYLIIKVMASLSRSWPDQPGTILCQGADCVNGSRQNGCHCVGSLHYTYRQSQPPRLINFWSATLQPDSHASTRLQPSTCDQGTQALGFLRHTYSITDDTLAHSCWPLRRSVQTTQVLDERQHVVRGRPKATPHTTDATHRCHLIELEGGPSAYCNMGSQYSWTTMCDRCIILAANFRAHQPTSQALTKPPSLVSKQRALEQRRVSHPVLSSRVRVKTSMTSCCWSLPSAQAGHAAPHTLPACTDCQLPLH
jgi:hypothetical protein